jgi:hypothetical protein
MYREQLRYLGDKYKVIKPIYIEFAASRDIGGNIYYVTVVNLQNELIFGVGRTKQFALKMLRESLKEYYESLMSSDLNRFYECDKEMFFADKRKLQRSIEYV